ncbi:TorD/DmsD family molecular chaperone [Rhodovulum sp. DZ06]|uniref:TorD/DmsD family molecular chaperone n=1 Tax=Rhodovulum sp. DZ06 TaxID=3425126 RepID=UPI003D350BD9
MTAAETVLTQSTAPEITPEIAPEDRMRADLYDFLGALLQAPPPAALLEQAGTLVGDETELGRAVDALSRLSRATSAKAAEREFNALFIGLGRGELMPFGSFYLTGFLNEKPLALLRQDMSALGIERSPDVFEPEDNIGALMEMMAGLIAGRFGEPASLETQKTFFNKHIAPWAPHFFADLEGADNAALYKPVGAMGRAFMAVEVEAFRMGG